MKQITVNEFKELIYKYLFAVQDDNDIHYQAMLKVISDNGIGKLDESELFFIINRNAYYNAADVILKDIRKILDSVGE